MLKRGITVEAAATGRVTNGRGMELKSDGHFADDCSGSRLHKVFNQLLLRDLSVFVRASL